MNGEIHEKSIPIHFPRSLDEFLENVALVSDQDTIREGNVPTLLTLHAAKGLEFGVVFIVGLDDGILPHSRSFDQPESMEEERRLFYVGITRAKDKLYLIRAIQRGGRGSSEETYPSRFLDDVPADLLVGKTRSGRSIHGRLPDTQWSLPSRPQTAPVMETRFRAGMHIRHSVWGEGIVLDSRIQDDDEVVDVGGSSTRTPVASRSTFTRSSTPTRRWGSGVRWGLSSRAPRTIRKPTSRYCSSGRR